jgi:hypothetical protein
MAKPIDRREFVKQTVLASSAAGALLSLEEKALMAAQGTGKAPVKSTAHGVPAGKIKDVTISRIICGGNLIGGYAHSRDLIYVSPLLKHYFTDAKVFDTLELCEENGINTIIVNTRSAPLIQKYWNERGGEIQWIAQLVPKEDDLVTEVTKAVDGGAAGAFVIGNVGDAWSRSGKIDLVGKVVDSIQGQGIIGGVAGHNLRTPMACEQADGIEADFYMKTFHSTDYWSTRKPDQQKDVIDNYAIDNYWDKNPEETMAFMKTVKRPWIAYKVLAAGAVHPSKGFKFAFENGADFACVGMFDFQVREDAIIAHQVLTGNLKRERPWMA